MTTDRPTLTEYEFTLAARGAETTKEVPLDAVFEAGCDDCLISSSNGQVTFDFARRASSFEEAVGSAIVQLKKAGVTAWLESVDSPEKVAG